jgi:hypothetical protein
MTSSKKPEGLRFSIKDIVIIAMMSAILFTVQVVIAGLPNIELVTLLVMIYTLVFKWRTIAIIYVFAVLQGLVYGFGPWWIMYLYIWTILYFVVTLLSKNKSVVVWAVVSGTYGLIFGALCSLVYFFMGGLNTVIAFWIAGIKFDIIHGVANFIICLTLFTPLHTLLKKLKT